jgi:hypothetical protein
MTFLQEVLSAAKETERVCFGAFLSTVHLKVIRGFV